jgi:hypothetical protein
MHSVNKCLNFGPRVDIHRLGLSLVSIFTVFGLSLVSLDTEINNMDRLVPFFPIDVGAVGVNLQ